MLAVFSQQFFFSQSEGYYRWIGLVVKILKIFSDRVVDRIDGRSEGTTENGAVVPVDVLADGTSCTDIYELVGRIDEYGGAMATEN